MNNKKGISLIVLVITILVMIILAGVVIVSLQNDNPINKAKLAKVVDSVGSVRAAISQYAVQAQADVGLSDKETDTVKSKMNAILEATTVAGSETGKFYGWRKLKTGADDASTTKAALGVDAAAIGEVFYVNPDTGASVCVIKNSNPLQADLSTKEGFVVVNKTAEEDITDSDLQE